MAHFTSRRTNQRCRTCQKAAVIRRRSAGVTWLHFPQCDRQPWRPALHLLLDGGLPLCDELPNSWDRYEPMSSDAFVLMQQVNDRDVCPRCSDAWNEGVDQLDEMEAAS